MQVAIISVVVLLLGILFASRAVDGPASSATAEAAEVSANDSDSTRAAAPATGAAAVAASNLPSGQQTPTVAGASGDSVSPTEVRAVAATATPTADSSDDKPKTRPGNVEAECWGLRGSAPWDYVVTLDRNIRTSGSASALISAQRESGGYATMFQTSSATPVRGRRVEFSADIRTRGATEGANLLLRAEDASGKTVAFDNMQSSYGADRRSDRFVNRGVMGNAEWSTQRVVVDIPESARVITYGVSLFGEGKAWIDNARIEVVTTDTATTAIDVLKSSRPPHFIRVNPESLTRSPRNLEFDLEAQAGAAPCN